jgi:hypothetical protein
MGSKTDYLESKLLNHVLRNEAYTSAATVYSALFTVIPSDSTAGTEVTTASSGYTRLATTFSTSSGSGASYNATQRTFATAAAGYTVVGWGLLDAATAGNLLYWATVTTLAIAIGDQATFAVSAISITED